MTESDGTRPAGRDPDAHGRTEVEHFEEGSYFLFRLAGSHYGVPATSVDHVADPEEPLPVPTAPAIIFGVLHLRGRIVGVIDIAALLGLPAIDIGEVDDVAIGSRLVVIESNGRAFGMFVDETLGIFDVRADEIRAVGDEDGGPFSGQFDHPKGVVTVLDPEAVLGRVIDSPNRADSAATP